MSRLEEIKERFELILSDDGWREDAWLNTHAKKDIQYLLAEIEKRDEKVAKMVEALNLYANDKYIFKFFSSDPFGNFYLSKEVSSKAETALKEIGEE